MKTGKISGYGYNFKVTLKAFNSCKGYFLNQY